ncbi:hypothetical protein WN943_028957 [Citrus x changshan-huyou]
MPNYRYVLAENPVFLGDKNLKIEKDVVGRALEKHLYMTLL